MFEPTTYIGVAIAMIAFVAIFMPPKNPPDAHA